MIISRRDFLTGAACAAAVGIASDGPAFTYDSASWENVREGLEFSRIRVYERGKPIDTLAVLRADPERNKFDLYHDRNGRKTAEDWRRHVGADAVFNAGFYRYVRGYGLSTEPAALSISEGSILGPRNNRSVKGAFVAEPMSGRRPYARLIDMDHEKGYNQYNWNTAVNSWPMLVHANGTLGGSGSKSDSRTAVCEDGHGRILAVTTEDNNLTLPGFARALRDSGLDVKKALNLDGGHAAQMYIERGGIRYATYGKEQKMLGIQFLDRLVGSGESPKTRGLSHFAKR